MQGLRGATDMSRDRSLSLSSSQVITKRTPADYTEALALREGSQTSSSVSVTVKI